jgi:F-type H+-transporting ATPase subunit delta
MALARSAARRYAEAAFEIAERDDSMEVWLAAFAVAEERLTGPDVMRLLSNPSIPVASRVMALEQITGSDVVGPQRNLLTLMVRRGRFELLPGVIREFARKYRLREGIVQATVTSATELKAKELEALRQKLIDATGSQVELRQEVDADILGGLQVRVGDQLIDGSVRGRLERLRTQLTNIAT